MDATNQVRVGVFGKTTVTRAGSPVQMTPLDLRVLTTLVHLRRAPISDVQELAWRKIPTNRALGASIYRIRKALGADAIRRDNDLVELTALVRADIDDFVEVLSNRLRQVSSPAAAERALGIAVGEPYQSMADLPSWAPIRQRWIDRVEDTRDIVLNEQMRMGMFRQVLDATRQQLARTPTAALRVERATRCLLELGQPVEAMRTIESARQAFARHGLEIPAAIRDIERAVLRGTSGNRPPITPKPAELFGRSAEFAALNELLLGDSGNHVVLVTGVEGVGKSTLAAAVGAHAVRQGWKVVSFYGLAHHDLPVDTLHELDTEHDHRHGGGVDLAQLRDRLTGLPERLLVVVDDAHHAPTITQALMLLASHPRSRLSLLLTAQPNRIVHIESTGATQMRLTGIAPDDLRTWLAHSRVETDIKALSMVTGGEPRLIEAALRELHRDAAIDYVHYVSVRARRLTAVARRLLGTIAQLDEAVHVDVLSAVVPVTPDELDSLIDDRFVTVQHCRCMVDPVVAPYVRDAVHADAETMRHLLAELDDTMSVQVLLGRARAWGQPGMKGTTQAEQLLVAASNLISSAGGQECVSVIGQALEILDALHRPSVSSRVHLLTRLAAAQSAAGATHHGDRNLDKAYRLAIQSGDMDLSAMVAVDAAMPQVYTCTRDGERGEQLLRRFVGDPTLSPRTAALVEAAATYHTLVRTDLSRGAQLATKLAGSVGHLLAADQARALQMLVPETGCGRDLGAIARTLHSSGLAKGDLSVVSGALVYETCADMREQATNFDDPRLTEVAVFAADSTNPNVRLRHLALMITRTLLEAPSTANALLKWAPSINADVTSLPLIDHHLRAMQLLGARTNWHHLTPDALAAWPVHPALARVGDQPMLDAVSAFLSGNNVSVIRTLATITTPFDRWAPSALWPRRLPILTTLAMGTGDRDLAYRLVDLHQHAQHLDLCMLPFAHLGPAAAWLAPLACFACHPLATELAEHATSRLSLLNSTVLHPL